MALFFRFGTVTAATGLAQYPRAADHAKKLLSVLRSLNRAVAVHSGLLISFVMSLAVMSPTCLPAGPGADC